MKQEIECTDRAQELYAHVQGKKLVKISDVHGVERFYIDGQVGTFWNGGPVMTEEDVPRAGYVCVSEDRKNHVWYPNNTIVQLVEEPVLDTSGYRAFMSNRSQIETNAFKRVMDTDPNSTPVPDAIVDTVVSNLSVGGDLLQEQIEKIRKRNVGPVADILVNELMEKVPAEEAIEHDMGYNTLEQIREDIAAILRNGTLSYTQALQQMQSVVDKMDTTIAHGSYIETDGRR